MQYNRFINRVQDRAGLDYDEAEMAAEAFFETLAERLPADEAEDLAEQLPQELAAAMALQEPGVVKYHATGFFEQIGEREAVDPDEAADHAQAVWGALKEAITDGELDDIRASLPGELVNSLER